MEGLGDPSSSIVFLLRGDWGRIDRAFLKHSLRVKGELKEELANPSSSIVSMSRGIQNL